MTKRLGFALIIFLVPLLGFSQVRPDNQKQKSTLNFKPKPNPWRVGGDLGVSIGNHDYVGVRISPFLGYSLTSDLEAGVSVGYQYASRRNSTQHLFNGGPYLNYYPIPEFFARAHYEYYTGTYKLKNSGTSNNYDENALWIGAGYRSTGRIQVYTGLMYNVLYKSDSRFFNNGLRPIVGVSVSI